MLVSDWMSSPAITASPLLPARTALDFSRVHGLRCLPVVESGVFRGVVTSDGLAAAIDHPPEGLSADTLSVEQAMCPDPAIVSPDDSLEAAARMMIDRRASDLCVLDGGAVVGILTGADTLRALTEMLRAPDTGTEARYPK